MGKVEGKLLQLLRKISAARRVVEVGAFTGYSALAMAEALPEDGRMTSRISFFTWWNNKNRVLISIVFDNQGM
ncbi:MAG: hypothetical protein GY815_10010 [Gammaproteobacteria bacterium]|nr:hypothetical protein [Gammaproteobacteria bacterium]